MITKVIRHRSTAKLFYHVIRIHLKKRWPCGLCVYSTEGNK